MARRHALVGYPRAGMTLIEFLVVIGIIAVLAGLVLTGSTMVRRRVDLVRCQANLLQLGVAVNMYVADTGRLPLVYYCNLDQEPRLRPPSPPAGHDISVALADYVPDHRVFECRATGRTRPTPTYAYNDWGSGMRVSVLRTPKHRALIMCDPIFAEVRREHGGRLNALFLDGHVKAYKWIELHSLRVRNTDDSGNWPYD